MNWFIVPNVAPRIETTQNYAKNVEKGCIHVLRGKKSNAEQKHALGRERNGWDGATWKRSVLDFPEVARFSV